MGKFKSKKFLAAALVALLLGAAALLVSSRRQQAADSSQPAQETVTAFIGDLAAEATASGTIQARQTAAVSAASPGRVTAVLASVGDQVSAGDPLLQLDSAELGLAVESAALTVRLRQANLDSLSASPEAADIAAAQAAVASAQANLDDLLDGPSAAQISLSEASVAAAEAGVASASAELNRAQGSIADSQILAAEASLLSAQGSLERIRETNEASPNQANDLALRQAIQTVANAQAAYEDLLAGPDSSSARGSLISAQARLEGSQADLARLRNGASATEIANGRVQLAQANSSLASLQEGPTAQALASAAAELAQAEIALADAQERLDGATVTAPIDGVVTAVNAAPGEYASGVLVELADLNSLELLLAVDEIDIGQIAKGQPVAITLETWPDLIIDGEVREIGPQANINPATGLVSYDVYLSMAPAEVGVKIGMSANASLITSAKQGVLLVASKAIRIDRTAGSYSVELVQGEQVTELPISVGLRTGQYTEVTGGLNEGDVLLVSNGAPVMTFGNEGDGGPFGGGMGQ